MDSNHRPHAYQACALTSWAIDPCGGGKGIRTLDPLRARQVLSQLSYTPIKKITWQRSTLPHSLPCSTIDAVELNFPVRNGKECFLYAIITRCCEILNLWFRYRTHSTQLSFLIKIFDLVPGTYTNYASNLYSLFRVFSENCTRI